MESSPVKLRREVEPPQRPDPGVAVMIVASAAMFFAIASSAFILRVRIARTEAVDAMYERVPVQVIAPRTLPALTPTAADLRDDACGELQVVSRDGDKLTLAYRSCLPTKVVKGADGEETYASELPVNLQLATP